MAQRACRRDAFVYNSCEPYMLRAHITWGVNRQKGRLRVGSQNQQAKAASASMKSSVGRGLLK